MKYKKFSDRYNELEAEVHATLRKEIEESDIESQSVQTPCIRVNVFDYVELAVIHDELMFLDSNGLQYGLYTECSLEDLIEILIRVPFNSV